MSLLFWEAALTFVATAAGVAGFRRWAQCRRMLDVPNARSSHRTPTPRGAGVVIVTMTGLALAVAHALDAVAVTPYGTVAAIAAAVVAAISLIDDLRGLGSLTRLAVHAVAAVAVVGAWGDIPGWSSGGTALARVVAAAWLVGLTNAYNFMDGVDGIAGGQAILTSITIACVAYYVGALDSAAVAAALAGASAGFLVFNWSPARVFMGDVGSAFLGFTFAALVLSLVRESPRAATAAISSLWPFLFDASFTLIRRALNGENVLASHRTHLYQRIVVAGSSHAAVATGYVAAGGIAAGLSILWVRDAISATVVVGVTGGLALLLCIVVAHLESQKGAASEESQK